MAKYICPSCGARYNGKKCRQCLYENFGETIAHGSHTHKGEPLVIDSPVRRPIPKKDPFGCPPKQKKQKSARQKNPVLRFLVLLFAIYSLLPMIRNWGLDLERREAALVQPEMAVPEDLVTLWEEGPITISIQPHYLQNFAAEDPRIWVHNELNKMDVSVRTRYVMANGFVLPTSGLYVDAAGGLYGMGTLYLYEQELSDAHIGQVKELTFVLEAVDEDYTVLFVTDPITLSADGRPVEPEWNVEGGLTIIDEEGIYMEALGYFPDGRNGEYRSGRQLFYIENNTDRFLSADAYEITLEGEPANLYLWANLPPKSRTVAAMDLWGLEEVTHPSSLGDVTMEIEFWDMELYDDFHREYTVTFPMTRTTPLIIS